MYIDVMAAGEMRATRNRKQMNCVYNNANRYNRMVYEIKRPTQLSFISFISFAGIFIIFSCCYRLMIIVENGVFVSIKAPLSTAPHSTATAAAATRKRAIQINANKKRVASPSIQPSTMNSMRSVSCRVPPVFGPFYMPCNILEQANT